MHHCEYNRVPNQSVNLAISTVLHLYYIFADEYVVCIPRTNACLQYFVLRISEQLCSEVMSTHIDSYLSSILSSCKNFVNHSQLDFIIPLVIVQ